VSSRCPTSFFQDRVQYDNSWKGELQYLLFMNKHLFVGFVTMLHFWVTIFLYLLSALYFGTNFCMISLPH
jgi:hypothetical protein